MPILFGRYELGEPLGSGGTATVYRARDLRAARDVALKIVPPGPDVHALRQRFLAEARALAKLKSRRIAALYDHGADETGGLYIALELVSDPLAMEPRSFGRPLLPHEVLRVARALLEGIADAHDAGVLHLDIKPRNVLVQRGSAYSFENPKIVDFGLAQQATGLMPDLAGNGTALFGTVDYMPPEALTRGVVSPRTDLYAAGLVLFELLGVGLLHSGDTREERLRARIAKDPVLMGRVPDPLASALMRLLARDEVDRFATAREAFETIADLDTAPVNSRGPMSEPPRKSVPPPAMSLSPATLSSEDLAPDSVRAFVGLAPALAVAVAVAVADEPPSSIAAPAIAVPAPPPRVYEIDDVPEKALSESLATMDMAMLDALSRRERKGTFGRVIRALVLTLRLDLDAAALLLEPLTGAHPIAGMVGSAFLALRARRVTRARVDSERVDDWSPLLAKDLASRAEAFAAVMGNKEDAERALARAERTLARFDGESRNSAHAMNLVIARGLHLSTLGKVDAGDALLDVDVALDGAAMPERSFDECARSFMLGLLSARVDPARATRELRRALAISMRASCTLLEVRALCALGGMLIESEGQEAEGRRLLSRASLLLAHGDLPTLLHAAEQSRGAALIMRGDHQAAAERFKAARQAARAEISPDVELLALVNEIIARTGAKEHAEARELGAELTDARLSMMQQRTQAFACAVRGLVALAAGDAHGALRETSRSKERVTAARLSGSDIEFARAAIQSLAELSAGTTIDEEAALRDLCALSVQRGFAVVYWVDILESAASGRRAPNPRVASFLARMREALIPQKERQTSPPPHVA